MSADRSRDVAKGIYFGAYSFGETEEGYLQAFQYSDRQMKYFEDCPFVFWYERCTASCAKTLEFTSEAVEISFDYKFLWLGSEDSFVVAIKNFSAGAPCRRAVKHEKVLWLGDSITQGYGPMRSSETYEQYLASRGNTYDRRR